MQNPFDWIVPDRLLASRYPATEADLAALRAKGVRVIVNLTDRRHDADALAALEMREVHLPVPDFTAPLPAILDEAIVAIASAHAEEQAVAVHCLGGLGRTGTIAAAWLVSQGYDAESALSHVRSCRPGSIEVPAQEQAVRDFARVHAGAPSSPADVP
jgi:atypical dual specificity phosphatase